jgi:hydrogenase 3 maturation protease
MADDLRTVLEKIVSMPGRLAILGAGSRIMRDDAAGVRAAENLRARLRGKRVPDIRIFIGETAPENLTGEIRKFDPAGMIIIDSAGCGAEPGAVMLIDPETIGGLSFNTHMLPMKIMARFLKDEIGCETYFLGIQHCDVSFGEGLTPQVAETADEIADTLFELLKNRK